MSQRNTNEHSKSKQRQNGLPVSIHPDDAKDKVFTAILKALMKMGNKPSSPKELANIIVKHKYATLGGATPFATVSSRISQHFKRAAEHNPPRAPLLAKHIDQNHSRKINYSLATESVSSTAVNQTPDIDNTKDTELDTVDIHDPRKTNSKIRKSDPSRKSLRSRNKSVEDTSHTPEHNNHASTSTADILSDPSSLISITSTPPITAGSDAESDGEQSDYHEEMLQAEEIDITPSRRPSTLSNQIHSSSDTPARKGSFSFNSGYLSEQELWTPCTFEQDFDNVFLQDVSTAHNIPFNIATPESISVSELDDYFGSSNPPVRSHRKSFSTNMPNDKSLLQKVLLASAARGVADKHEDNRDGLASGQEKPSHKEENDTANQTISMKGEASMKRTQTDSSNRQSDARNGQKDTSNGQTDSNHGQADINKSRQADSNNKAQTDSNHGQADVNNGQIDNNNKAQADTDNKSQADSIKDMKQVDYSLSSFSSNNSNPSLMHVDNSEDFVKFEDDEKKEIPPPQLQQPSQKPQQHPPILPAPSLKKMADILPATSTTLSTAELLKSLNIQNLNLSAIHQMTANIPNQQHLSPTFDLVRTMAAYMQTLAQSANTASSSSSSSTVDIKSILARLHALEPLLKKEPVANPPPTPTPPLVSPITETVPNLISVNSNEPIVNTLTPMNPPMYITIIDHIAVCIAILEKTETSPEYRIMRRVDTGFINGTILLTAGGIETESERSMILSFEMERIRMPKKKSPLFGTWIPLRRAQELAVTCSIQHKLGHFLEDSLESYFPSPLPIHTRKPRDGRLSTMALAAFRADGGFVVPPISRPNSSSGSMAAAQLQELLLNHPHRALKSNGVVGTHHRFDDLIDTSEEKDTAMEEIDTELKDGQRNESPFKSDLFKRPLLHIHPRDLQKKRRRSSLGDEPTEEPNKAPARKKLSASAITTAGGKWSGGKFSTSAIKKSASFAGSTNTKRTPSIKKSSSNITSIPRIKKQSDQEMANVVVEHSPHKLVKAESPSTVNTEKHEDDEDEDIDIGGSDFDDDLR